MKWLFLFLAIGCKASELEIMRARSTSDLAQLRDRDSQQTRLFELCRLEKEQMVVPVACLSLGQLSSASAEILCARSKPIYFLEAVESNRTQWPQTCQEAYMRADERKRYRESF